MDISMEKQREYMRRILMARMNILANNGFFGLLLMHMKFALDDSIGTAATDGEKIYFDPDFLDDLSDSELIFILEQEIMHIVLQHTFRTGDRNNRLFNVACDIVVNSNILYSAGMNRHSITLAKYGESMHVAPDGSEGYGHTAEEVYDMFAAANTQWKDGKDGSGGSVVSGQTSDSFSDDHSKWGKSRENGLETVWKARIKDAYEAVKSRGKGCSGIPAGVERELKDLFDPKTDWRVLLNDFVQEEVVDYSFAPPDRRFSESPFFLPDFNETETVVKNVLFMIDTSGSMTDEEITQAYSEIKGAIDQFGGRLEGRLGFFDAAVVPPEPFADESEFMVIRPSGGGGTSFRAVFDYIRSEMADVEIASLIIMTDGYARFPDESASMGIPVLWMINNDIITPPWGRVARI